MTRWERGASPAAAAAVSRALTGAGLHRAVELWKGIESDGPFYDEATAEGRIARPSICSTGAHPHDPDPGVIAHRLRDEARDVLKEDE